MELVDATRIYAGSDPWPGLTLLILAIVATGYGMYRFARWRGWIEK